jgi:hypothetical protein
MPMLGVLGVEGPRRRYAWTVCAVPKLEIMACLLAWLMGDDGEKRTGANGGLNKDT